MSFIDLVIGGCDFSGTSTQTQDLINYFKGTGKLVKDIRGTEIDAMFHIESFSPYNKGYMDLNEFSEDSNMHPFVLKDITNTINNTNKFFITSSP